MSQASFFLLGYGLHFKETNQKNKDPSAKGNSGCRLLEWLDRAPESADNNSQIHHWYPYLGWRVKA